MRVDSEFPCKSSCNGNHFVRWPDYSAPPPGRRCHPHGTKEQMLVKGEKRGKEMGGRRRVRPRPRGRDAKHLFVFKMLLGSDSHKVHAATYLQVQSKACITHAEGKLILSMNSWEFLVLLFLLLYALILSTVSPFHLAFICCDAKHFEINLVC